MNPEIFGQPRSPEADAELLENMRKIREAERLPCRCEANTVSPNAFETTRVGDIESAD